MENNSSQVESYIGNDSSQVEIFCYDSSRLDFFQHHFALLSFLDFFDKFI